MQCRQEIVVGVELHRVGLSPVHDRVKELRTLTWLTLQSDEI